MTDIKAYAKRRAALLAQMQHGIAIVPTARERARNRDSEYLYRFDSYFYYLSGFHEPEAVLVLIAGAEPQSLLFCREKNLERETWDGFRYGPEAAKETFGVDAAYPIGQLDEKLPTLIANQPALHYAPGMDPDWDARIMRWLGIGGALLTQAGTVGPARAGPYGVIRRTHCVPTPRFNRVDYIECAGP